MKQTLEADLIAVVRILQQHNLLEARWIVSSAATTIYCFSNETLSEAIDDARKDLSRTEGQIRASFGHIKDFRLRKRAKQ